MQPQNQNVFSFSKILFAGVLTLVFLSVYTYFFPQKPQQENQIQQTQQEKSAPNLSGSNVAQSKQVDSEEILARIEAKDFDLEIDTLGRIRQVFLKDQKFISQPQESIFAKIFGHKQKEETKISLPLLDEKSIRPLEIRFADSSLNQKAFNTPYVANQKVFKLEDQPLEVVLTQTLGDFIIKKILTIKPDLSYTLEIQTSDSNQEFFLTNGARPIADSDRYAFLGTIISDKNGRLENLEEGDIEGIQKYSSSVFFASVDRYFASVLFDRQNTLEVVVDGKIEAKNPIAFAHLKGNAKLEGYIGAKNYQELKALYAPLGDVVEYGLITFFAKPLFLLLEMIYEFCGNWGWAIVLLTIIVRLVLFPLSYKGMMGMQKLKELAPEMKEIQAKYKSDPQKMQKHMMDLYRKHGANPLGGCLPLLLQIPVFFAIYKVLYCAVELKSAPWILWIIDLSAIDPYYVLPVIMGVTMYISQILTPSNFTDPMQEKVFKMLPLFFTFFFIIFPFPAGLVLYWSVNNVISIFQQILINKIVAKQKEAKQ
ncbi:membrane protein insertase YidC [Helicobacter kayseriensis]|uniref:membrane protein insertase YidC n=1 Tax=Helicobacter kayseriensis TaxID=2905877 RepID=UPI001E435CCF|nr:membrane protein insertase YidC [Helicobacter kayseriensis]MCE3047458.1 membrane protein insertase YidC [Helicobacter kayseriensis]MCE3048809.1 membrane protein insertase YidC [Helicobacter kayseriensis]